MCVCQCMRACVRQCGTTKYVQQKIVFRRCVFECVSCHTPQTCFMRDNYKLLAETGAYKIPLFNAVLAALTTQQIRRPRVQTSDSPFPSKTMVCEHRITTPTDSWDFSCRHHHLFEETTRRQNSQSINRLQFCFHTEKASAGKFAR